MAIPSKKVFISANAFLAFVDRAHPKHTQAAAFFRYFAENKYQVYTGYINVQEAHRQIFERISPSLARDFIRAINLGSINIIYPNESDVRAAIKTLTNYRSAELTFYQAQMAVLANKNSISQICTFEYLHQLFGITVFYLPL